MRKFNEERQKVESNLNHFRSLGVKNKIQENYSLLGDLYLTIGDLDNAITQFRTAKNYICLSSSLELIPSLKKVQLFRFEEEELQVVPHTSVEIYTNSADIDRQGFERFHISCLLIASRLLQFERVLELAKHVQLNYSEPIQEFTNEKDLAYYIVIALISLRNYKEIVAKSQEPQISNFIQQDIYAKQCINNIIRNDFINAVKC